MIWWVVLLFLGGMALVVAEFMLPGGVLGALGVIMVLASAGLGLYAYPEQAVLLITAEILGSIVCILGGIYVVSKSGFAGGLTLRTSQRVEEGYVNLPTNPALLGATGTVYTPLRPSGTIEVNGERLDAVADGAFIAKGATVRVTEVHGNRVVVEPVEDAGADTRMSGLQST